MPYLLITVLIWSFAFGLVKHNLTHLDPYAASAARLAIASLVFLPFLKRKSLHLHSTLYLMGIGAVQYGLMYCFYMEAAQYLQAYEIALFTLFIPIYLIAIQDIYLKRFSPFNWTMALLALGGALVIRYTTPPEGHLFKGFYLMQAANLCFAWGTITYKNWRQKFHRVRDHELYFWLFLGGTLLTALFTTFKGNWNSLAAIDLSTGTTLVYLSVLSTGVAFFTWNKGALSTHPASLAVISLLKVPLGILASLLFFGESTDWLRLGMGLSIMLMALFLAENQSRKIAQHA
jgi:drug/metabolite transporter (DMT)-like permease